MTSRSSRPILPLTSIRFFAAFYVVLLHSMLWSNHIRTTTWIGKFLRNGYVAVGFFFVLSGYILAHIYLDTGRSFNRRAFWTSRFARVYPLLFASLLLDVPNSFLMRLNIEGLKMAALKTSLSFFSECALLQSLNGHFRSINAPSWSLSAEAFFYLIFPLVAFWIWRRSGLRSALFFFIFWLCAMATPVITTYLHPGLFVEVDSSNLQWAVELWPIFRMFEFFSGISLCALQKYISEKLTVDQKTRISHLSLAIAVVLYCTVIQFSQHIPLLVMSDGFLIPIYALVILGLVNNEGWIKQIFSNRYLVILGESSYAIYLLHSPIWLYFSRVHLINTLSWWILYVSVVLAASVASFYLLERPARSHILAWAAIRPTVVQNQEEVASR
ncbi:MAG: acyltransferase family protein [Acidobacteriaceae bacterium]